MERNQTAPHIVIDGNPVDGFNHTGPFESFDAAREWIEATGLVSPEWWIVPLDEPENPEAWKGFPVLDSLIPECDPQLQALLDEQDTLDEAREVARKVKDAINLLTNYGLSVKINS